MDWNDVRLMVEIGRLGSFAAAAEALGVSKPTVSRRVAWLEQTAGARLFRRGPHGATLTAMGEQLVLRAVPIEEAVVDFERLLRRFGSDGRPPVTAEMTEGVASYLITPVLARERVGPLGVAAYRARIELPMMRLMAPGSGERADLALVWAPPGELPKAADSDLVRKLGDIRFVPFYSAAYGRERRAPTEFDQIGGHRLITMRAYRWFADDGWASWHRAVAAAEDKAATVDWSSAVGFLVRGGAGIGLLPTYAPMYSDGVLPLEVSPPRMAGSLWACCGEDAYKDRRVRNCIAALGRLFREAEWMDGQA